MGKMSPIYNSQDTEPFISIGSFLDLRLYHWNLYLIIKLYYYIEYKLLIMLKSLQIFCSGRVTSFSLESILNQ